MGVMGRANQKLGGGGDWLDKDELIRLRTPLAIVEVRFDRAGTSKFPGENWILSFEPWDNEKFPGPSGAVRFKNLPTRQAQFEDIAEQLEEQKALNVPYIGPVAMISGQAQSGQRFKTLADVLVDEQGNILVDGRGFPRIEGQPEPEPTAPAPAPGPRRPTGSVQQQSTGQRERAEQATQAAAAAPAPAPAPEPEPAPAAATAAPARRGRRPANPPAPLPPGTPREVAQHEQEQLAQAAAEPIGPNPAIQQVSGEPTPRPETVTQTIPTGTALCPHCKTEIGPSRVYPAQGGGYVIMHAHCPVTQQTEILPVVLEGAA